MNQLQGALKKAKCLFKGNGSLFTKPCELMMTHQKNEVHLATQIFRMVVRLDSLRDSVAAEFPYPISHKGFLSYFQASLMCRH